MKKILLSLLIVFIVLAPKLCISAPSISGVSGTVGNGESITITGTDFGNGPTVSIFDDFELGTNGITIKTGSGSAQVGQWDVVEDSVADPVYSNTTSVSGNLAYHAHQDHYAMYVGESLPNVTKVFGSWWFYLDPGDSMPNNWKIIWWTGNGIDDDDIITANWVSTQWLVTGNDTTDTEYTSLDFSSGGTWRRVWVYMEGTTSSDGVLKLWTLGSGGVTQRENVSDFRFFDADADPDTNYSWEMFRLNGYCSADSGDHRFDDAYVAYGDYAQARIEIGNASTYSSCTNLTVVTPTSWSGTSITGTVWQGSFVDESTAYVYVFDSTGAVSSGYEVTIGSGSGPSPDVWYLAESAAGTGDGSSYANRMSRANYNAGNLAPDAGDTIVLCGAFTGELTVQDSGSATNEIVFDGDASSYDGSATDGYWDTDITGAISTYHGFIYDNGYDYLIFKNIAMDGQTPTWADVGAETLYAGMYFTGGTENITIDNCDFVETVTGIYFSGQGIDVKITRNLFDTLPYHGIGFSGPGVTYPAIHTGIIIGGESGMGNEFINCGAYNTYNGYVVTGAVCPDKASNGVFSYNYIHRTDGGAYGQTSFYCDECQKWLVERNIIDGGAGETAQSHRSAIDFKGDQSATIVEGDVIVRYNYIRRIYVDDNDWGSPYAVSFAYDFQTGFVYGNYFEDNGHAMLISTSTEEENQNDIDVEDIYFFSNIINETQLSGWSLSGHVYEPVATDSLVNVWCFNNTFYKAATYDSTKGAGVDGGISSSTGYYTTGIISNPPLEDGPNIYNNLYIDVRPNRTTDSDLYDPEYRFFGYNESQTTIVSDYNHIFHSLDSGSSHYVVRHFDGPDSYDWDDAVNRIGYGGNSTVGNPYLNSAETGDFRPTQNTPSSITTGGSDLGTGNIGSITITFDGTPTTYYVPWDFALGEDTVWSTTDPDAISIDPEYWDTIGSWGKGAYAFTGEQAPPSVTNAAFSIGTGASIAFDSGASYQAWPPLPESSYSEDSNIIHAWLFESDYTDSQDDNSWTEGSNAPSFISSPTGMEGDYSIDFTEANNELAYITDASLNSSNPLKSSTVGSFTILMRMRADAADSTYQRFFSKYLASSGKRSLEFYISASTNSISVLSGYDSGNSYYVNNHGSALTQGHIYYVAYTYNTSTYAYRLRIYDDTAGSLLGTDMTGSLANAMYFSDASMSIGNRVGNDNTTAFDGAIDELVIINEVWDTTEIDTWFSRND